MENNANDLIESLRITNQSPLDAKTYVESEEKLKDLGDLDNLAYTYGEGLIIYSALEGTRWEWREAVGMEVGLLPTNFIYPDGWVSAYKDYSSLPFNFFLKEIIFPIIQATSTDRGIVKTDITQPDPIVYTKDSVDLLLDEKVDRNLPITADTKTKITYNVDGIVTSGDNATTADINSTVDKRYVTDADLIDISNLSGTNTGDQSSIVGITGTKLQFNTALNDGNFIFLGEVTQYTDELAQDAIGNILTDTSTIAFTYTDGTPSITGNIKTNSITAIELADNINVSEFINDSNYVIGTGTTNKLSRWTSSTSQGNSLIGDDGTGLTIGGNTTPTINASFNLGSSVLNFNVLYVNQIQSNAALLYNTSSLINHSWYQASIEKMRLTIGSNIIIQDGGSYVDDGTNKLQVTGSGNFTTGVTVPVAPSTNNSLTNKLYVDTHGGLLIAALSSYAILDQIYSTTASVIIFSTDSFTPYGSITRSGNTFIALSAGIYSLTIHPQITTTIASTVTTIWAKLNGIDIPTSAVKYSATGVNDTSSICFTLLLDLVVNDTISFYILSSSLTGGLLDTATTVGAPATPSVSINIKGWRK